DNCPGVNVTQTAGPAPGSAFVVGTTAVTYQAQDAAGNTAACSFTVHVIDNQPPMIQNCPTSQTVSAVAGQCSAAAVWTEPTVSDNLPGAAITRTNGPAPGSVFAVGVTNIVYTASDIAGNTATCSFSITVTDDQNPIFSGCPANIAMPAD